jgi:DNA-binding NarL/FixJ family response regulator
VALRCLIVDDNRGFLDSARALLERQGLAIVGVASTSADALREAETLRPDLVLVDVSLGEEDGFELARRLVPDRARGATVILILDQLGKRPGRPGRAEPRCRLPSEVGAVGERDPRSP